MKNYLVKSILLFGSILFLFSCNEDDINPNNKVSGDAEPLVAFRNTTSSLGVTDDISTNYLDVLVDVSNTSSTDRNLVIEVVDSLTTATPDMYTLDNASFVVPANSNHAEISVFGNYDLLEVGASYDLVLNIVSIDEGGVISESKGMTIVKIVKLCPVPDDYLVGDYLLYTNQPCLYGNCFGDPQTVTVYSVGGTKRAFEANYLQQFNIGQPDMEFVFDLICNQIIVDQDQNTYLQCDSGLTIGSATTPSTYDLADDSFIEINFTDNVDSDCSDSPVNASIILEAL